MPRAERVIPAPDLAAVAHDVARALAEDLGSGDVSAALVPDSPSVAKIICRDAAVICGKHWVETCVLQLDPHANVEWQIEDGDHVQPGAELCRMEGSSRALLSAERSALNFLQTLSATATATATFVAALAGTSTRILDTRKTLPGLRLAQKYAVRCGGGNNHRIGLFDTVMLKENHILAAGGLSAAIRSARSKYPELPLIVEVETLRQLEEALACGGATRILLDNFSLTAMREAVALCAGRLPLEASGGLEIESLRAVAETGVDFISIGALTKHIRAVDLSMRFAPG
ncbi:MAG: carboxylating nicotinate-nucleotide diphosphorylase [Pseudomarimonas sp.]